MNYDEECDRDMWARMRGDGKGTQFDHVYEGEHADEIQTSSDAFSDLIDFLCEVP